MTSDCAYAGSCDGSGDVDFSGVSGNALKKIDEV